MKKNNFILLLLLFFPFIVLGQKSKDISISYEESDFLYETVNNQLHIVSKKGNSILWGDTIDPALPCINVNILIAPTENYISMSYECQESLIMQDVIVEPNPIPIPTNNQFPLNENRKVKYTQMVYPNKNVEYTGTHLMDGYKYISLIVCPFRYDPQNKKLYFNKNVNIKLNLSTQIKRSDLFEKQCGNNMRLAVKKLTINGNELETLYKEKISTTKSLLKGNNIPYKYIIVTNDSLRPAFDKLAKWKTIKGIKTKVITVNECYNGYPDDSHMLAIKKTLSNYYYDGMEYVLLAGDVDIIPIQNCFTYNKTKDTKVLVSDLYYACLDQSFNWDGNENSIYAEDNDNADFAPEYIISRVSVSNYAEAETFTNRIIEYESSPQKNVWENKMLSLGTLLYDMRPEYNPIKSDSQWQAENVYENHIQPFWDGSVFKLFDTYTDHIDGANYEVNVSHIQSELEKGYIFIDEFSHAKINCWGFFENWSKYMNNHAETLVNNGYSIISTISCFSNSFDLTSDYFIDETEYYTKCLSEAFMRNPYSGVLAFFGSSREGWCNYSYLFDGMFYEHLLSGNDKQFGRAAMLAKNSFLGNCFGANIIAAMYYRWLILSLNSIGDPEMPVFTDAPKVFNDIDVNFSNGTLNVSTGVDSCRICISSAADNGNEYYNYIENTNSGNFYNINSDCYLCISKQGYIPYLARVGPTVYLQNENIKSNLTIHSTSTIIGDNVTQDRQHGEICIEKGTISNKSKDKFKIMNALKVKRGAELRVLKSQ